jgi:hypothetical protein
MDPRQPFDPRRRKPAAGDKVEADRQDLARRIEINARTYHGLAMPGAASNSWFCIHGLLLPWLNVALYRIQPNSIVGSRSPRQGFASPGFAHP